MHRSLTTVALAALTVAAFAVFCTPTSVIGAITTLPAIDYTISANAVSHITFSCLNSATPTNLLYEPITDTLIGLCPNGAVNVRPNVTSSTSATDSPLAAANGCTASSISIPIPNSGYTSMPATTLMMVCSGVVKMVDLAASPQTIKTAFLAASCGTPGTLYSHFVTCTGSTASLVDVDSTNANQNVVLTQAQCPNPTQVSFGLNDKQYMCGKYLMSNSYGTISNISLPDGLYSRTTSLSGQFWDGTIFAGLGGVVATKTNSDLSPFTFADFTCNTATFMIESTKFELLFAICGDKSVYVMSTNQPQNTFGENYLDSRTVLPKNTASCATPRSLLTNADTNGIQVFIDCGTQGIFQYTLFVGPVGSADASIATIQRFGLPGPDCQYATQNSLHLDAAGTHLSAMCGNLHSMVEANVSTAASPPSIIGTPLYYQDNGCTIVAILPSELFPGQYLVTCDQTSGSTKPALARITSTGVFTTLVDQTACPQSPRVAIVEDTIGGDIYFGCNSGIAKYHVSGGSITFPIDGVPGTGGVNGLALRGTSMSRQLIITSSAITFYNLTTSEKTYPQPNNAQYNKIVSDSRGLVYVSSDPTTNTPGLLAALSVGQTHPVSVNANSYCPIRGTMTVDTKSDVLYVVCQTGHGAYSLVAFYQPDPTMNQIASTQVIGWNARSAIYGVVPVTGGVIIHTQLGLEFAPFDAPAYVAQVNPVSSSSSSSGASSSSSSSSGTSSGSSTTTSSSSSGTSSSSSTSSTASSSSSTSTGASSSTSTSTATSSTSDSSTAASSTSTSTASSSSTSTASSTGSSTGSSSDSSSSSSSTASGISGDSSSSSSSGGISSAPRTVGVSAASSSIFLLLLSLLTIVQLIL